MQDNIFTEVQSIEVNIYTADVAIDRSTVLYIIHTVVSACATDEPLPENTFQNGAIFAQSQCMMVGRGRRPPCSARSYNI